MSCASCVGRVERVLKKLPGVQDASVNLATEQARIQFAGAADVPAAIAAIEKAGYSVPQHSLELQVKEMTCASCVGRVERILRKQPGVLNATVNLATERATVQVVDGVDVTHLLAAVSKAGYPAQLLQADAPAATGSTAQRHAEESQHLQRELWIAAALALPVFVMEMGGHLWPAFHHWVHAAIGQHSSWALTRWWLKCCPAARSRP